MTELARGDTSDPEWGRMLAALALRGLTGQLTMIGQGGRLYEVAFDRGAIVAASSPLASDTAVRIAMTFGLISSKQAHDLARGRASDEDEIAQIVQGARLSRDASGRLRRGVISHRAARTLAIESGDFVVADKVTLQVSGDCRIDIRAVMFLGAKSLMSAARLDRELARLGSWFQLRPEALGDLALFEFSEPDLALLEPLLLRGAGIDELEQVGLDRRVLRAMLYALASCDAVSAQPANRAVASARPSPANELDPPTLHRAVGAARPPAASEIDPPTVHRRVGPARPPAANEIDPPTLHRAVRAARPPAASEIDPPTVQRAVRAVRSPAPSVVEPPKQHRAAAPHGPGVAVASPPPAVAAKPSPSRQEQRVPGAAKSTAETLFKARLRALEEKRDYFALLDVPRDATTAHLHRAYLALARYLHPDNLAALGISDPQRREQLVFSELNIAFATLSDPVQRAQYARGLERKGAGVVAPEPEEEPDRGTQSKQAFRRGMQALQRDQITSALSELELAVRLTPDDVEYRGALVWARFAAATDKEAISADTRAELERALKKAPGTASLWFYLGRVERILGRASHAMRCFREVLQLVPKHVEAASELRVLEMLQSEHGKRSPGRRP